MTVGLSIIKPGRVLPRVQYSSTIPAQHGSKSASATVIRGCRTLPDSLPPATGTSIRFCTHHSQQLNIVRMWDSEGDNAPLLQQLYCDMT
jgi:hypothetical protein